MEFDEAKEAVRVQSPLPVDEVAAKLAEGHAGNPQKESFIHGAMAQVREGLAKLASLGHQFRLVEHDASQATVRYPLMLYKSGEDGGTKVVETSEDEASAKKDGWSESPTGEAAPSRRVPRGA